MKSYVALLRGIGPSNPNMHGAKLQEFFESLGFKNVRTLLSSGNIIFESVSSNTKAMEIKVEKALPQKLGFSSTTIIRSREELQKLVDSDPFKNYEHNKSTNLNVTFLKSPTKLDLKLPHQPEGKSYTILSGDGRQLCSVIDLTGSKTPDLMTWLERQFGKQITTRTWQTVQRILAK